MPTVDSFGLPIPPNIFNNVPGGISYMYAQFQAAIAQTMANFTAVPTAGIHAVQATMPYIVNGQVPDYDTTPPHPPAPPGQIGTNVFYGGGSRFIWPTVCGGPTGNGVNEFIFLRQRRWRTS